MMINQRLLGRMPDKGSIYNNRLLHLLSLYIIAWACSIQLASGQDKADDDRLLAIEAEVESFFRNNEYDVRLGDDYTLPGYRCRVNFDYTPNTRHRLRLRAGIFNHYYWGANLYPDAPFYSDLPYWSDEGLGYTRFRIKPFVQASLYINPKWELILGSLSGGMTHRLIVPLYNPELRLTSDNETGIQLRHQGKHLFLDTWVDWRSFIFRRAKHQEAFIAGISADYRIVQRPSWAMHLRGQGVWAHRGGVENTVADTVHTWSNIALGAELRYNYRLSSKPTELSWGLYGVSYNQRGGHYLSPKGWGAYTEICMKQADWEAATALWYGDGYMGILSTPFVQSEGLRGREWVEKRPTTSYLQLRAQYHLLEEKYYTLGCRAALWWHQGGTSTMAEVYLAIRPHFRLLKRR